MPKPATSVRRPTWADVCAADANIREADRLELLRYRGRRPIDVLADAVPRSTIARTLLIGDQVAAIWGVVPADAMYGGSPWALTTNVIDRHRTTLLESSPYALAEIRSVCLGPLSVFVDAEYHGAGRWLRWLGFDLRGPYPVGIGGHPFWEASYV